MARTSRAWMLGRSFPPDQGGPTVPGSQASIPPVRGERHILCRPEASSFFGHVSRLSIWFDTHLRGQGQTPS
ncbi:uncharacterized protein ARMOST_02208 [Armillaria ostoyae]|uniref:Uncharacterized protein n=1 Tax=Armillaria ostoyae TaxID=47428 RepID=A0A284QRA1_ARMOS|nr:uncharacterized protein ARMOST_02208 [Armillaria ostoyae]